MKHMVITIFGHRNQFLTAGEDLYYDTYTNNSFISDERLARAMRATQNLCNLKKPVLLTTERTENTGEDPF
jgi:hypothetical protein